MTAVLNVVAGNTSPVGERAKALPLRDTDVHDAEQHVSANAERQHNDGSKSIPRQPVSRARREARPVSGVQIRRAMELSGVSQAVLADAVDMQQPHLSRALEHQTPTPFPAENFILIAKRAPRSLKIGVIVAFAELDQFSPEDVDTAVAALGALAAWKRKPHPPPEDAEKHRTVMTEELRAIIARVTEEA